MRHESIKLLENSNAILKTYILDDGEYARKGLKHPAMLVCPGGGYAFVSKNEGEPVALAYAKEGFSCFVLEYSVKIDNPFPQALRELAKAVSIIRENAEDWLIDKNDISVVGFSAGGNLAFSLGLFYNKDIITSELGLREENIQPNNIILGYPAITVKSEKKELPPEMVALMDEGLFPDFRGPSIEEILLGKENPTEEEVNSLNLLQYVNKKIPRTFIWGSQKDGLIPPTDLLDLASALNQHGVSCELHFYENGPHGMSLADRTVKSEKEIKGLSLYTWFELSLIWLRQKDR